MLKIKIALLLLVCATSANARESVEERVLICQNGSETYFIKPSGILYAMTGLNGAPNCLAVVDTKGKEHLICRVEKSEDTCELSESKEL